MRLPCNVPCIKFDFTFYTEHKEQIEKAEEEERLRKEEEKKQKDAERQSTEQNKSLEESPLDHSEGIHDTLLEKTSQVNLTFKILLYYCILQFAPTLILSHYLIILFFDSKTICPQSLSIYGIPKGSMC